MADATDADTEDVQYVIPLAALVMPQLECKLEEWCERQMERRFEAQERMLEGKFAACLSHLSTSLESLLRQDVDPPTAPPCCCSQDTGTAAAPSSSSGRTKVSTQLTLWTGAPPSTPKPLRPPSASTQLPLLGDARPAAVEAVRSDGYDTEYTDPACSTSAKKRARRNRKKKKAADRKAARDGAPSVQRVWQVRAGAAVRCDDAERESAAAPECGNAEPGDASQSQSRAETVQEDYLSLRALLHPLVRAMLLLEHRQQGLAEKARNAAVNVIQLWDEVHNLAMGIAQEVDNPATTTSFQEPSSSAPSAFAVAKLQEGVRFGRTTRPR